MVPLGTLLLWVVVFFPSLFWRVLLFSPLLSVVLRFPSFSVAWCCLVGAAFPSAAAFLPSFGWRCFLSLFCWVVLLGILLLWVLLPFSPVLPLRFPFFLLRGVAWPLSLGVFPSPIACCCLPSPPLGGAFFPSLLLGGAAWLPPVLGRLGGSVLRVGSCVGWLDCALGRVFGGWVLGVVWLGVGLGVVRVVWCGVGFSLFGWRVGHSFLGLGLARPTCGWRLGCAGVWGVELSG